MNEESLFQRVLHLRQVEKLSQRQIAMSLGIGRKRVRRILKPIFDSFIDLSHPLPTRPLKP